MKVTRERDADLDRLAEFAAALDRLREREQVGPADLEHVQRVRRFSVVAEAVGRTLVHVSFEPVGLLAGSFLLFLHKQVEVTEIGHTALHGVYDRFGPSTGFHSSTFRMRLPADDASWKHVHNIRHHGFTNVMGHDPDFQLGFIRFNPETPWHPLHAFQLPMMLLGLFPNLGFLFNLHFSGLQNVLFADVHHHHDRPSDIDLRPFRKWASYYAYEYLLFPALAGPFFWKVLLGNWISETLRDGFTSATIYAGHVGEDVARYASPATRSRGEWYARQVESTNNFEVHPAFSWLLGGGNRHIEHHLFPKLPPQRLREIAPEVRAICEAHGVRYRTGTWAQMLGRSLRYVAQLARPGAFETSRAAVAT